MALDAEKRIPDTTLPANSFKDGDILYGSDMNRVVDTLKTAVNENYKDLKGIAKSGEDIYIEPIEGVVDAEGQPIDTVDGLIKWLYDNKILNEGKVHSLRINDLGQFEYYDGENWKLATVGQQGDPGEGVPTGGLSGQFLRKQSDVSYDTEWVDAYDKSQVDTFITNLNNATRINLLKPTQQTTTVGGVTIANNGDGTYTLNGTGSNTEFYLNRSIHLEIKEDCKYTALNQDIEGLYVTVYDVDSVMYLPNTVIPKGKTIRDVYILIANGTKLNNVLVKPMITPNLNATYDDFVSYEDSLATNRVIATREVSLSDSGWSQEANGYYTQTVSCDGITSADNPIIDIVLPSGLALSTMQYALNEYSKILTAETLNNSIKFYASEVVNANLTVLVKGV